MRAAALRKPDPGGSPATAGMAAAPLPEDDLFAGITPES